MRNTIADLTRAGVVAQLCRYHHDTEGPEGQWDKTTEYAMREFRDLDSLTIGKLIEHCRAATTAAILYYRCTDKRGIDPSVIPKKGE